MSYAQGTEVGEDRSRAEIEKILKRYGANAFAYGWKDGAAMLGFEAHGRMIRFELPMPRREDFLTDRRGRKRPDWTVDSAVAQESRRRWRALALVVKAKLEAVESKIADFEAEFLAYIVLPNQQTVGEFMVPQIAAAYESRKMPPMLGWSGKDGKRDD